MPGKKIRPSGDRLRTKAQDQKAANIKRAFRSDNVYSMMKKGGKATHKTKDGRTAKKGLWYNIHQKRKRGGKPRKPGSKGAPTAAAFKRSARTSKKS